MCVEEKLLVQANTGYFAVCCRVRGVFFKKLFSAEGLNFKLVRKHLLATFKGATQEGKISH